MNSTNCPARLSVLSATGLGLASCAATIPVGSSIEASKDGESSPFSFAAYGEGSRRSTQFFQEDHDANFFQLDSRLQYWLPPGKDEFSWGPYVRYAFVSSSSTEAFENAYLALPGVGLQLYPFSGEPAPNEIPGPWKRLFGPLRFFAEYNRVQFEGDENDWRPDDQVRAGVEYWRARGVNDVYLSRWSELWLGSIWNSSNEFDNTYDTLVTAGSLRLGQRLGIGGILAQISPYLLVEGSKTKNETYFWENRLLAGAGLRWTPPEAWIKRVWLGRLVVFGEYLHVVDYLEAEAPPPTPDDDWRVGISFSLGDWFR